MEFASSVREFVTRLKGREEARDQDNSTVSAWDPRFGALSLSRLWHTASLMHGARLFLKDTERSRPQDGKKNIRTRSVPKAFMPKQPSIQILGKYKHYCNIPH